MNKKIFTQYILMILFLVSCHERAYAVATYLPVELRDWIVLMHETMGKRSNNAVQELYSMIMENRVLASDGLVRKAIHEALETLEKSDIYDNNWKNVSRAHCNKYLNHLNDRSILLNLQGNVNLQQTFPCALVARCKNIDSTNREMLLLSNELTVAQNLELCGAMAVNSDLSVQIKNLRSVKPTKVSDPGIMFNPNMMTSSVASVPNVIFGTGVSAPVINAWSMAPSSSSQTPINMQFLIPGDFKTEKAISLELHFLVDKQFIANGEARIRINALYVQNNIEFSDPITFIHTTNSKDFFITEPSSTNELTHIFIDVPLEKSDIAKRDFAVLSLTRIAPDGLEYAGDIYLATAVFKYTRS